MNDEKMLELSNEIDDYLLEMATKYEMSPMSFVAVVLARLSWISVIVNGKEEYLSLLNHVKDSTISLKFESEEETNTPNEILH